MDNLIASLLCAPDAKKPSREYKGESIIEFPSAYCVVDIETTGVSPMWDSIIEIGAIRYVEGKETERFQTLIGGVEVDDFISRLTGITNEMLSDAPSESEAIRAFDEFLGDDIIVGYNVCFDINFLYDSYEKYLNRHLTNNYIDLLRYARKLYPEMQHHRLRDMVERFEITNSNAHRALSDVEATEACFKRIHEDFLERVKTDKYFSRYFFKNYFKSRYKAEKTKADNSYNLRAKDILGDAEKNDPDNPLYERYCVFTGTLSKLSRKEAMQLVADLGGINQDTVTKKTNYLILGNNDYCKSIKDGKSTKQKKAEQYMLNGQDIEILPETEFYEMLGILA